MRSALSLTLGLALFLSGCAGSDDGSTTTATTTDATTTMTTTDGGTAGPGGNGTGTPETLRCTTTAGGSGNAQALGQIGGCTMNNGVEGETFVVAINAASGCTTWYDTTPGDASTEGEAAIGATYPDGTAFGVYCDATMPPNSESTMDVLVR